MNRSAYARLFQELGFTSVSRGKKLRHSNNPPTLYFNVSRDGEVYFTGRQAERDQFSHALWKEVPARQKKDRDPLLVTFIPIAGREAAAFRDLLTRSAFGRSARTREHSLISQRIPQGITEEDVRQAAKDIDANRVEDTFGESRLWDVLIDGRLYPPKRIVGVAARRLAGRVLVPRDFTGGEESKCHELLEDLGYTIVPKGDTKEIDPAEEARIEAAIRARTDIPTTTRERLIYARRGTGRFRREVAAVEKKGCRMTGVTHIDHLRASHIKPWSASDDRERLDPYNGLLLSPHIDHLFDRGFISFTDQGELMVSKQLKPTILGAWGLATPANVAGFRPEQCVYLEYHRQEVFRK